MIKIENSINNFYREQLSKKPNDKTKYVFIVDDYTLALSILAAGYMSVLIEDDTGLLNFVKYTIENMFTSKSKVSYVSDLVYLPCLSKVKNDVIIDAFKENFIEVNKDAYKIFGSKGKSKEFYRNNSEELNLLLADFIESNYIQKNEHFFDLEKGKISAKKLDMEAFAKYIIGKYKIIKIENSLHYFCEEERYYPCLTQDLFDKIVMNEVYNTNKASRKEYMAYLQSFVIKKEHSSSNYIMFDNGIYDLQKDKLLPATDEFIISTKIKHNYREVDFSEETVEMAENVISTWACGDQEIIQLLYEVIGSILYMENPKGKTFFLQGTGGNGKSTFFDFLDYLIGGENVIYRDFSDFEKEYNVIAIKGKMLLICDDMDNKYIEKPGLLKKIVTGEPITGKELYYPPEVFRYKGKLLCAGNDIPRINDTSNGLGRRLIIIPFKANLSENKSLIPKEQIFSNDVAEYILYKSMIGLKNVLKNGDFTKSVAVDSALKEYHSYNNPIIEFIEEYQEIINTKACSVVYDTYRKFCDETGVKSLGRNTFFKKMEEQGWRNAFAKDKTGKVIRTFVPF